VKSARGGGQKERILEDEADLSSSCIYVYEDSIMKPAKCCLKKGRTKKGGEGNTV
jgi:hypothetical protein